MDTNASFRTDAGSATSRASRPFIMDAMSLLLLMGTAAVPFDSLSPTATRAPSVVERRSQESRRRLRAEIEDSLARMKEFSSYSDDWDSNGASAPSEAAINAALFYLTLLQPWHPAPLATLSRDGEAVLEFDEDNAFSSIRFRGDDQARDGLQVEVYKRANNGQSDYDEGPVSDDNVNRFLRDIMKLPPIQNGNV